MTVPPEDSQRRRLRDLLTPESVVVSPEDEEEVQPARGGRRINLAFAATVVLIAVAMAAGAFYLWDYSRTNPVVVAGRFMEYLQDGSYAQALDSCTPELRQQLQGLEASMERANTRISGWNLEDRRIVGDTADLRGTAQVTGNRRVRIQLRLARVNGEWKISALGIS